MVRHSGARRSLFALLASTCAALPEWPDDDLSVWERFENVSSNCTYVSGEIASKCRSFNERHYCRVKAARRVWGTPCYAQSWQSCVARSADADQAVFPSTQGADSKCVWCSPSASKATAAYSCTSGASSVCPARTSTTPGSCANSDDCRIDAMKFPVADPTLYFDPYWDLHCRNGGVRAWQWGPSGSNFNGSDVMLHGGSKCKCPSGWTGVECAQCVGDASCVGTLGAGATCDKSLGSAKPLTQSCTPLFSTNDFFWTSGEGLTTVSLHISRKRQTLQMMFHGQIDFPWNREPIGWGQSNGFLGNGASFIATFTECTEERHVACPKTTNPIRPADATCMIQSCTGIVFTCPMDLGPDADIRFEGCAPHNYFPKKGTVTWACAELDVKAPSESFGLGCSFGLPGFLPWEFGCDVGTCRSALVAAPAPDQDQDQAFTDDSVAAASESVAESFSTAPATKAVLVSAYEGASCAAISPSAPLPEELLGNELSEWDRYAILSSNCTYSNTSGTPAACRTFDERHACRVAAARRVWGTPCYAQSWQSCVTRTPNGARAVFPSTQGTDSRCVWCSPNASKATAAYSCTSSASSVCPARTSTTPGSCANSDDCRNDARKFPVTDPTLYFDPLWDLHCRNGGVRHWTYAKHPPVAMSNGNNDCVCPPGWTGVECAQCVDNSSCSGDAATCDRTIGLVPDAPLSASCMPVGATEIFFEMSTQTLVTVPNLHISRKRGTVRLNLLGETDFPWNLTFGSAPFASTTNGFLQNPTAFHIIGSECTSERNKTCPAGHKTHPLGALCNNIVCPSVRYECPSDCDSSAHGGLTTHCLRSTSRFVNCPAPVRHRVLQFFFSLLCLCSYVDPPHATFHRVSTVARFSSFWFCTVLD